MGYLQIVDAKSCVRDIKTGCIQGSALGLVLLYIHTSKLPKIVTPANLVGYADGAYIICSHVSEVQLKQSLTETLRKHFEWLSEMGMVCNMSKTELIFFGCENSALCVIV